jgi:hypothetical protein
MPDPYRQRVAGGIAPLAGVLAPLDRAFQGVPSP